MEGPLDISNTVESTDSITVEGVATADMSFCSVFLNLAPEKATEKTGYKNFRTFYSFLGVRLNIYLSSEKVSTVFFYIRVKNVLSTVKFTVTVFLVSGFHGNIELRKQKMTEFLSMNHHRAPRMEWFAINGTVYSFKICQCSTNFSICNLNTTISTPVFMSYSIVTRN